MYTSHLVSSALIINSCFLGPLPSGLNIAATSKNPLISQNETATADTKSNIKELIEDADLALSNSDPEIAIEKYQEIISKFSSSTKPKSIIHCYRKMGIAKTMLKQYDSAIKDFNQALKETENETDSNQVLNKVTIKYSLARAYEGKGDLDNAIATSQSALALASEKLTDSPYLIRRLRALKSELYFSHVAQKLNVASTNKESDPPKAKEYNLSKPLIGKVSSREYFKAKSLMSEVPALDTSNLRRSALKAKTSKTTLFSGTKKVKNKLTQKLMEYGTMSLSLKKDVPGFPWYIRYVLRGGAGQRYGAQKGDIVNSVDGHPIKSLPITTIYHMFCGRRGEMRTLGITRKGKKMFLRLRLLSVYEIGYAPTEYIEYYWFLLYNGYITNKQYARLAKPYERYLH